MAKTVSDERADRCRRCSPLFINSVLLSDRQLLTLVTGCLSKKHYLIGQAIIQIGTQNPSLVHTGRTRLIRRDSSASFSFELSGNSI